MNKIVFSIMAVSFLAGCQKEPDARPRFYDGQMVKMKAFGTAGMVVYVSCFEENCYYSVRFPSMQMRTNVSLLGSDGPVDFSPVSIVRNIREFELVPAD